MNAPPIAWTIAGSDSGGGAGIQADIKTMQAFGVHGCSVITALTAQNTVKISGSHYATPASVTSQINALGTDLPPAAVKIGMLGKEGIIRAVARQLADAECPIVVDPVMVSSTGTPLLDPHAMRVFEEGMLPLADLLTPNREETERLTGLRFNSDEDVEAAAEALMQKGCKAVLIKGGHTDTPDSRDYFSDGETRCWLSSPRIDTPNNHGTGCVLSSAIVAALALGYDLKDAVVLGKMMVNQGLRTSLNLGEGAGPLGLNPWTNDSRDMPAVRLVGDPEPPAEAFPDFTFPEIPVYPIVNSADEVDRMLAAGARMIQLRLKTNADAQPDAEIPRAIQAGKVRNALIVVNDEWERAIQHSACAVHVGQDDLPHTDFAAIHAADMLLGISTHSLFEIARAKTYRPSYMAIGTVFPTTSKELDFAPLGVTRFTQLAEVVDVPVVAIGGLSAENAGPIFDGGADVCAVISDLGEAEDPAARIAQWREVR